MATFISPDSFKEHKQYVVLLKKALLQVKGEAKKKFLYYKQYSFGEKKLPLVLVDFDLKCSAAILKAGHKPAAEGVVSLTPQDELNFEANKGELKRIKVRNYFKKLGTGIKPVFVPEGETDDEEESDEKSTDEIGTKEESLPPQVMPSVEEKSPPPIDKRMEKKVEFEEKEFKRRQVMERIQEMQSIAVDEKLADLKKQALAKATTLAKGDRFGDANKLLDVLNLRLKGAKGSAPGRQMDRKLEFEENQFKRRELEKRIGELQQAKIPRTQEAARKQALLKAATLGKDNDFVKANQTLDEYVQALKESPPPESEPTVPKERKLSSYIATTSAWQKARRQATEELQRLEKAIITACDGEPVSGAVIKQLPQLHTLVAKLDDRLGEALNAGAKTTDPEKQLDLDKQTQKLATSYLETLRSHPLADAVDENPFGSFRIMSALESVLGNIEAEFQ